MLHELSRTARSYPIIHLLIQQDLKVAHRDKILGNLWMLLGPLLMMTVLFVAFHNVRHTPELFILYLLSGLMAWEIVQKDTTGLHELHPARKSLIHRIPLPLGVFPAVTTLQRVHDLLWGILAYCLVFAFIKWRFLPDLPIPPTIFLLPVWAVFFFMFVLGLGFFLARVGVFFRDMTDIVGIVLRMGFFLNPVFLDVTRYIPEHLHRPYFLLNPVAGFLVLFRRVLPGGGMLIDDYQIPIAHYPLYLAGWSVVIFVFGFWFFQRGATHYTKNL